MSLEELRRIAEVEFSAIVSFTEYLGSKLRIQLRDGSFVDAHLSQTIQGRLAFHWERRHIDGTLFRIDNFPDVRWKEVETFPYHFHNGTENKVNASPYPKEVIPCFRAFMDEVVRKLL